MTPRELDRVACAPAFTTSDTHDHIATDVIKPPTRSWQRPIIPDHIKAITDTFNTGKDFMPNPVLLSQNDSYPQGVLITPQVVGSSTTGLSEITLDPSGGDPLWIIDGQHRIKGLAASSLADQKIPVVLMLDDPHRSVYKGPILAKIFAQVTTEATALGPLHNDWLKFAFRLDKYQSSQQLYKAMTTVVKMTTTTSYTINSQSVQNEFFNHIKFNDYLAVTGFHGSPYTCTELKELILKYYYSQSLPNGELSPVDLACQVALAYDALMRTSPAMAITDHCILGDAAHRLDVMRNGFIASCLSHLVANGVPKSWFDLFSALDFQRADWNFDAWKIKLHGEENTRSFEIAVRIFTHLFHDGKLPNGISSLDLYFRGNNGEFVLRTSEPTKAGGYSKKSAGNTHAVNINQPINRVAITNDNYLRLDSVSPNITIASVENLNSPRTNPQMHQELTRPGKTKGLLMDTSKKAPLKLNFKVALFGGNAKDCEVDFSW